MQLPHLKAGSYLAQWRHLKFQQGCNSIHWGSSAHQSVSHLHTRYGNNAGKTKIRFSMISSKQSASAVSSLYSVVFPTLFTFPMSGFGHRNVRFYSDLLLVERLLPNHCWRKGSLLHLITHEIHILGRTDLDECSASSSRAAAHVRPRPRGHRDRTISESTNRTRYGSPVSRIQDDPVSGFTAEDTVRTLVDCDFLSVVR